MKKAFWMAVALFAGSALAQGTLKGKVAEKVDGGGYTYLKIGESWAAVPRADVKVGSQAEVALQTEMKNFNSPTLNRTFASVWFGTLVGGAPAASPAQAQPAQAQPAAAKSGQPGTGEALAAAAAMTMPMSARGMQQMPANHPPTQGGAAPQAQAQAQAKPSTVRKAGAVKPIASVFADLKKLKGQEITVKGKVVKFTAGVMGKNWIHLQDGSGNAEKKNHDLTITTQGETAVGEQITVTGVLLSEQDIGSGYYFDALLDDATIQR